MAIVPKHVAVIMDGNRRFSRRLMAKPWKGHEWGAEKVEKFLNWCNELGVEEVTLYAFSVQNFERSKEEFDALMKIFLSSFEKLNARLSRSVAGDSTGRVRFIGRRNLFPADVQTAMNNLENISKNRQGMQVNVAMGYGGREEVIDAVRALSKEVASGAVAPENITEDMFAQHLYMVSEPDLVMRTGGEHRTSNFLLWQSSYAEWIFLEKCWPELEREDFVSAITEYGARERRFGK